MCSILLDVVVNPMCVGGVFSKDVGDFFNADVCRPGCSLAFCVMRHNDCVRACARRMVLSQFVCFGIVLYGG